MKKTERPVIARRNIALMLLQAREGVMGYFRRILNHYGLTEQQWRVIRAIYDNGAPMEQWQICETCQILSPSLAGVLVRMEDMELVARKRVDTDQRRMLVSLTAKSQKLIKQIAPLIEEQYDRIEAAAGRDVLAGLYVALDKFLESGTDKAEPVALEPVVRVTRSRKAVAGKETAEGKAAVVKKPVAA